MKMATIPGLDVSVSRLGFGCMRFPTLEDGKIDRVKAAGLVDLAYQSGVNYFDTAYGYHGGESELFIGEALKQYPRDSFYLADKLPIWLVSKPEDTDNLFQEQLVKTQVEFFDFYLIHALNAPRWKAVKENGVLDKLTEFKKQGKLRRLGFSYHGDLATYLELVDAFDWDFVQLQVNYVDWLGIDAKAYYDKLCEKKIPCVVMEPVRGGFLASPPDEVKADMATFEGGVVTPAGWAMRWCIDKDNMPVILSGMSAGEQVRENLATFSEADKLTEAQAAFLERCAEKIAGIKAIPCTACGYCMPCPFGVDIPEIFGAYNRYKLYGNAFRSNADYKDLLDRGHGADQCTKCGACALQCPQSIDIPGRLPEMHDFLLALMP